MVARPSAALLAALLAMTAMSVAVSATAHAAPGRVSGTLLLAAPSLRGARPELDRGFVPRAKNAFKPVKPFDPLPYMVVVLRGGPVADADKQPPQTPVQYKIIGESFAAPVLPIQAGGTVEIKNEGLNSPRLYSPDLPKLLPGDPLNPKGVQSVVIKPALRAIRVRDHDSAHLEGIIVAFQSPYFAHPDDSGKFEITGVPPGVWKVRIWYRTGWLKIQPPPLKVTAHHTAHTKIAIPPRLEIVTPGGGK